MKDEKTENKFDFENDITIDIDALDMEWLNQANVYYKYSREAAEARKEMDDAYHNHKVISADMELQMKSDPDSFGLPKTSEATIEAAVKDAKKVHKARQEFLDAKYRHDVLMSAVRALEMKKEALENLVRLANQDYFTLPSEPRETGQVKEKLDQKTEETNNNIREVLNN